MSGQQRTAQVGAGHQIGFGPGRLESWKAIGAFLGRDGRTVRRWELERGLPVRRVPGARSRVFAYPAELNAWLVGASADHEALPRKAPPQTAQVAPLMATPRRSPSRSWIGANLTSLLVLTVAGSGLLAVSVARRPTAGRAR